jgi:uncharacterized membrane protein YfcA
MARDRLGVTALGVCLLAASVLTAVNVPVDYHDLRSMLTASAVFAAIVFVPGAIGWGLVRRRELARRAAIFVFLTLGLLVAVLGIVYVGFSIRLYRAILIAMLFCVSAMYLHRDQVRGQFAEKSMDSLSLR